MNITGEIKHIKYTPFLCDDLQKFTMDNLSVALENNSTFILTNSNGSFAMSKWVSAKRTRSYPYARVYNTLSFTGRRITIIPVYKDEGKDGDRDFLQFDTISLMSLLQVYVIIAYYVSASKNPSYENKITNQKFDFRYIISKIQEISSFQSDALHWNMDQLEKVSKTAKIALEYYLKISNATGVKMHSYDSVLKKIISLKGGIEAFKDSSRANAILAQEREVMTTQPKEFLEGEKATITIMNFYKGFYAFTVDECFINDNNAYLIEGKHSRHADIPSTDDIKDGLLKMVLYSNLNKVTIDNKEYSAVPVLKLTSESRKEYSHLDKLDKDLVDTLVKEAKVNNFKVKLNDSYLC